MQNNIAAKSKIEINSGGAKYNDTRKQEEFKKHDFEPQTDISNFVFQYFLSIF
jgi:hypothetical protein